MKRSEMDLYAARLLGEISHRVGRHKAIGMGELYEIVFRKQWANRINDTRDLRIVITELRKSGVAICSDCGSEGGGYYLAQAGSELDDYRRRVKKRALKMLSLYAKLGGSVKEFYGQMELDLAGEARCQTRKAGRIAGRRSPRRSTFWAKLGRAIRGLRP